MARLNLTIPDSLYERLEQLRDRVNVSKICAAALAKELDMIEGTMGGFVGSATPAPNPLPNHESKVERLIERFQQQKEAKEIWRRRGRQDGETWAMERGSLEELRMVGEEWDEDIYTDPDDLGDLDFDEDEYPTLNFHAALERWVRADAVEQSGKRAEADWREYLRGWREGVRDLWHAAKGSL